MISAPTAEPGSAILGEPVVWAWRHPRPAGVEGLCIGSTDVPLDRRKARRLARRVAQSARSAGLPRVVITSTLQRGAEVGRCLRRWGWVHRLDPALAELDFGRWEGTPWPAVPRAELDAWCADFANYAPGGGESLNDMLKRAGEWQTAESVVVIAHAGWMLARRWLQDGRADPPTAVQWPKPPKYGERWLLPARRHEWPDPNGKEPLGNSKLRTLLNSSRQRV